MGRSTGMGSRRTGFNVWVGVRAWVAEGPARKEWKRGMEVSSVYGDEMQFQFSRNTGFTDSNNYACNESRVRSLGREDPLEEGTATHSITLAWRTPWTEEPGGLQSMESQRVGYN